MNKKVHLIPFIYFLNEFKKLILIQILIFIFSLFLFYFYKIELFYLLVYKLIIFKFTVLYSKYGKS